jgi:hypothetical protein
MLWTLHSSQVHEVFMILNCCKLGIFCHLHFPSTLDTHSPFVIKVLDELFMLFCRGASVTIRVACHGTRLDLQDSFH